MQNWIDIGIKKPFPRRYYDFLCIERQRNGEYKKTIIKEKTYNGQDERYLVMKSGRLVRAVYKVIAFRKA